MVNFRDLTNALSARPTELSADEGKLLIQRAALEMAERSVLGAFIVPLCFALAVITSGYVLLSPYACLSLALLMLGFAVARLYGIKQIRNETDEPISPRVQVFFWSCLGMAAVWGITTAIFVSTYLEGFPVLFILILSAGIGAGSMSNFCIWQTLAVNYLILSLAPSILVGLIIRQTELLPIVVALVFFLLYLLAQVIQWNFHFWDSLITAFLFERQATKLSTANSKLAEVFEKEQESRREVEKSRLKIRELFNLTNDGIVICALNGNVLDINQSMLLMLSKKREEIVNILSLQTLIIPVSSTLSVRDHWEEAVREMEDNFECKVMRSGEQEPLLAHVNLRRVVWQEEHIIFVTFHDITTKRQMEDALKITKKSLSESEGYLDAILRNVELPIYCKNLEGSYLTVNRPFEKLFSLTLDELRGKNDLQVFPENVGRFLSFRDSEIVETGESLELEGTFAFGNQERNLLVHKFPLRESGGSIYATAGICTDVTTMQKALHTAHLANEAKSEFLANMSHELRTPMHSILSIARLGLKRVDFSPREKLKSYFEMIVTSGDQLLELLSDLLDLSTLESTRASYSLGEYDLAKDLEKVINEFVVMMDERKITLSYHFQCFPAPARYDRTKLYQVLRNLLANAMKFSTPQKEVKVILKKDYLEVNGYRQSAWKVMVVDQGVGVASDELESVFGKFVKGSKTYRGAGGVGLGLSICKRIIEDHNGIIWAEQNEAEGTTFCFLLPFSNEN